MASVKLDTVRAGVRLLSGLLKKADFEGDVNGKVTKRELREFKDSYGDGGSMDAALDKVYRYAQAKYHVVTPTVAQLNKALADAMKNSAKADTNRDKGLDAAESRKMAATWKSVVEFSKDYQGMSVRDIMHPQSAP